MTSPTIMIVDDERDSLESLKDFLSIKDYSVRTADCLADAKTVFEEEDPDGILLDLKLPDGNGLEWIPALREASPHAAILVVTGSSDIPTAVEAMKLGADHFLTKPIDTDGLSVILERSLSVGRLKRKDSTRLRIAQDAQLFLGNSKPARTAWDLAKVAASNESAVLIRGETGSGKGMMARWIHENGDRAGEPFVEVNCSSLGGDLLSSTLFGHRKGAFTSAVENREGLVEVADGGTLFLDEIGDMDLGVQAQFLKVIEEKTFRRIGETKSRSSDFRLICATNKDLKHEVETGTFRQDLYYRICVFPIEVPPLRECIGDLPELITYLLQQRCGDTSTVSPEAMQRLRCYSWPGNIRELANVIERAGILSDCMTIQPDHLPGLTSDDAVTTGAVAEITDWSLDACEASHLKRAVTHFDGNVPAAANAVGVSRATFYRKLKRHGIEPHGL